MPVTQTPPPPFGQAVGEAETALRALIDGLLDEAGTVFEHWVVLQTLATRGPSIPRDTLRGDLARALRTDPTTVDGTLAQLTSAGLVHATTSDQVEMTTEGRDFHRRLRESIGRNSASLLDGLDPGDVQTTINVLREVTTRARARASG